MQEAFVKRWHLETSSFNPPIGKMTITLDNVSSLLHLPIKLRLLNHMRIGREEVIDMMVTNLGDDLGKDDKEEAGIGGAHSMLSFIEKLYKDHLQGAPGCRR